MDANLLRPTTTFIGNPSPDVPAAELRHSWALVGLAGRGVAAGLGFIVARTFG